MSKGSGGTKKSTWRKSTNVSVESLKSAINALPDHPNGMMKNDAKNPLKYGGLDLIEKVFLRQDKWYDNKVGNKTVNIDDLETIQPIVNRSTLLKKIDSSNHTSEIPVVDYHGRMILIDGNHTAVIKKLSGEKKIKVTLYKFKE